MTDEVKSEGNVKCSGCGKDTVCEQCKAGAEGQFKHLCMECYQKAEGKVDDKEGTHICIPQEKIMEAYDQFMTDMTNRAFSELWASEKKRLKELSKQDLAKMTFTEGARFMLHFMRRMSAENEKKG
jgi:hypothetical protein